MSSANSENNDADFAEMYDDSPVVVPDDALPTKNNLCAELIMRKIINANFKSYASIQEKKNAVIARFDDMRVRNETVHMRILEMRRRKHASIASLEFELGGFEETLTKMLEQNTRHIADYRALIKKIVAKCEAERKYSNLLSDLHEKVKLLLAEREQVQTKLIPYRENISNAREAYVRAALDCLCCTNVDENIFKKIRKLRQKVNSFSDAYSDTNIRKKQIQKIEVNLKHARRKLMDLKADEVDFMWQLETIQEQYEKQKHPLSTEKSTVPVIEALMREKTEGRLSGVLGRLGDLAEIDEKFDAAISVACNTSDYIVVDTIDTAQASFKFLQANNMSCATFIPLDVLEKFVNLKKPIPENVSRLVDLIEDECLLPAFYCALKSTVLADDLSKSSKDSQICRVIKLNNGVIEPVAMINGEESSVCHCKMNMPNLEHEMDAVYKKGERLKTLQASEEVRIQQLTKELNELFQKRKENPIGKIWAEEEPKLMNVIKGRVKNANNKPKPEEVRQKIEIYDAATKTLNKAEDEARPMEERLVQINAEIDEIYGDSLDALQKKINQMSIAIDTDRKIVWKHKITMKITKNDIWRTKQRIEALQNEIWECNMRLEDVEREYIKIEENKQEFVKKIDAYAEEFKDLDENDGSALENSDDMTGIEKLNELFRLGPNLKIWYTELMQIRTTNSDGKCECKASRGHCL